MKQRKPITIIVLIMLIAFFSLFCSEKNENPAAGDLTGEIIWTGLSQGIEKSKNEGKPLLIYFYSEWCRYCDMMDSEIFRNSRIADFMNNNYINVRVNPEKDNDKITVMGQEISAMDLFVMMEGRGFPSTVFWDKTGIPITIFPGYMESGIFLPLLEYMAYECYNADIRLDDYVKGKSACSRPDKN